MHTTIRLRAVQDDDLPIFFTQQLDPDANYMAAFTAKDPSDQAAFQRHWQRIRADATVIIRTILYGQQVAGTISSYEEDGKPEITYWLGKEFWGKGIATQALTQFLAEVDTRRPMHARVAKDNPASQRVLEKGGFVIVGEDKGFANARQAETAEWLMLLT